MSWSLSSEEFARIKVELSQERAEVEARRVKIEEELTEIVARLADLERVEPSIVAIAQKVAAKRRNGLDVGGAEARGGGEPLVAPSPPLTQKQMVLEVLRTARSQNVDATHIATLVRRRYNKDLSAKHLSTYLGRLEREMKIRRNGKYWIPVSSGRNFSSSTPDASVRLQSQADASAVPIGTSGSSYGPEVPSDQSPRD